MWKQILLINWSKSQWRDWTDKNNHDKAYMIKDKGNKGNFNKMNASITHVR